jgi:hypothetical protein
MGNLPSHGRRVKLCERVRIHVSRCIGYRAFAEDICSRRSQIYKRGYVFRRGSLVIQMFQQEQASHLETILLFNMYRLSELMLQGRSKDTPANPRTRRYVVGGGSQNRIARAEYTRDTTQPVGRCGAGGAAPNEGPA